MVDSINDQQQAPDAESAHQDEPLIESDDDRDTSSKRRRVDAVPPSRTPHIPTGQSSASWSYFSPVPPAVRASDQIHDQIHERPPCLLGVDEAGRGPVLDSKTLTEPKRDALFARMLGSTQGSAQNNMSSWLGWAVTACSPQDISEAMLRKSKHSLNAVANDTTIALIQGVLDRGINVQEVYVDTVGPPDTYQKLLANRFPSIGLIVVAKKADSLYPIVSAASICAKVTRDAIINQWTFAETCLDTPRNFGSGYPGDAVTVAWLKSTIDPVFGFTKLVRFSWSTADKLMDEHCVLVLWEHEAEPDSNQ
eukprot:jgi/Hompol1/5429/HPOL_004506-RA